MASEMEDGDPLAMAGLLEDIQDFFNQGILANHQLPQLIFLGAL